ncbi:TetR family transcriptional regulator [Curtobacterium sp. MCJR17_020]|uniref:TetR/AcrR family transcriptional regulator n=1 Tax=Curtobacterium sp. MCJR17_020 TaxID=2175619 RepID=UPI000DA9703B|nr:TetR family transcriptional regulator [Curtobacterium sp. MCJR17_020]WIE74133.1 TetR family transcriptional regulator [Curtobacterium sp. MCJR17_020]
MAHDGTSRSQRSEQPERRQRRSDPDRARRILTAAVECIAVAGVAGATHRAIAQRADVPLGSVTYHFASIEDVVERAFGVFVDEQNHVYADLFTGVGSRNELMNVLVRLVVGGAARSRSAALGFELHLAALHRPGLRPLVEAWTLQSRATLAAHVGSLDAARLDALLEGMILQSLLSTTPVDESVIRSVLDPVVPQWSGRT